MSNGSPLRVLFVGLKFDYGRPERGPSFEYINFYDTLRRMDDVSVEHFPFDEVMRAQGRREMNARLLAAVNETAPDLCFFFLFTDEISKETIRRAGERSVTLNWFADDHWRFGGYSRFWSPCFQWVVTTDREAEEKYRRIGLRDVIHSQWGFNDAVYKPASGGERCDVSFVGQVHSNRLALVEGLRRKGIKVECRGKGWPGGHLVQEEMVALFSSSRINLNFTESSSGGGLREFKKALINRRADDTHHLRTLEETIGHLASSIGPSRMQIKGRNFEIPGSGGFLLTQYAEGIEEYFVPGKEIATFSSEEDLFERIRHYLSHDDEREAVRLAGHRRAMADHTFRKRFHDLFAAVFPGRFGKPAKPAKLG